MSVIAHRTQQPAVPTAQESRLAEESGRLLAACIGRGKTARIRVIDGREDITVPIAALKMLVDILAQMARGNAVTIVPIHAELTTQEAADFLNVSRPYFIGLLEEGGVPFRKVGTHRRVRFEDLLAYRDATAEQQQRTLDELTRLAQESGQY